MAKEKEGTSPAYGGFGEAIRLPTDEERNQILAETAKTEAETQLVRFQIAKAKAEALAAASAATMIAIDERAATRAELETMTNNVFHRVYTYTSPIEPGSVRQCMDRVRTWQRLDSTAPIEIVFTSPGGSIIEGMALFDFLRMVQREGTPVITGALGMAASMAGILLQAGSVRWMGSEAWMLIHQGSYGVGGSVAEVEDRVKWVNKLQDRILNIFAARSKMTKAAIKKSWERTDWWLSSTEALDKGFVDEVR